jgi:cytidylate kinase
MRKTVIAIDGPAGSGKGTISRLLADRLGFSYLDTGLLYRALAYLGQEKWESVQILEFINSTPKDVFRSDEISNKASAIAKLPEVRKMLLQLQRDFAANPGKEYGGAILDGRDIATVIVPDANHKIFITADLAVRALRRFVSSKRSDPDLTYEDVYQNLAIRDEQDKSREIAPLVFNDSYDILIDTSKDSIEESFAKAYESVMAGKCILIPQ